jgi:mannose-6-phosphate isomerase-like protein (cupin superfamily)
VRPNAWDAPPGEVFGVHAHERRKLLVCREGSIRFVLDPAAGSGARTLQGGRSTGGEVRDLGPGDWLDLPAGQPHRAVAGPDGVCCEEAFLPPPDG